jgi:hypothetical protein
LPYVLVVNYFMFVQGGGGEWTGWVQDPLHLRHLSYLQGHSELMSQPKRINSLTGVRMVADPDPHGSSLLFLDPDPGVKIALKF